MSALLSWNDNNEPSSSVIRPVPKLLKTKHRGKQRKTQVYGINALCQLPVELIMEVSLLLGLCSSLSSNAKRNRFC